jgi:hypothetical protein
MESLKERIKIFLTIFQFGMTFFLGTGVSFIHYINKQMELQKIESVYGLDMDLISITHILFMVLSASCAIYFLIQADSTNDELFDVEEGLE